LLESLAQAQTIQNYLHLPLLFDRQAAGPAERYVAHPQGYAIAVQGAKISINAAAINGNTTRALSLEFIGARSPRAVPGNTLPGKVNYINGNDPSRWRLGLPTFGRVTYKGIYRGIDVAWYGNRRQVEFDLTLSPGANPKAIRMKVGGEGKVSLDSAGALVIGDTSGDLRIALPKIYQEIGGVRRAVGGRFTVRNGNEVAFNVEPYDRTHLLVIDPTIVFSTLLGGATGPSQGQGIAVDSAGNIYLAGYTSAADFPVDNAFQWGLDTFSGYSNYSNGFVTKINPGGTAVLYSTYIGGSGTDQLRGIAVDSAGSVWVAGWTGSADFPVLSAANAASGPGAVVLKLDSSGALIFSTCLGGSAVQGNAVAVDASGNAYVAGSADNTFQATPGGFQSVNQGGQDAFVAKFTSTGSEVYATFLGGAGGDAGYGIAADSNGNAYATGSTSSTAFPGAPGGGAQPTNAGGGDAFIAKVNPTGTALVYFTFFGGKAVDQGNAIAVDAPGNAYVAGYTASPGLASAGAAQTALAGGYDGFIAKLNPAGTAFNYVTYLGGNRQDQINGLALDGSGNVYVAGQTESANFPVQSAVEPAIPGGGVTLYQTLNSGTSWSALDTNISGAVFDISADPVTSGTIVVATEQGIYRTTNNGVSWAQQLAGPFFAASLSRSPANPPTIYTAVAAGSADDLYVSTNGGLSWTLQGNLPYGATSVVADPLTAETVYAFGFVFGVYYSTDGGKFWNTLNQGLGVPQTLVSSMMAAADGTLYVDSPTYVYKLSRGASSWVFVQVGGGYNYSQHSLSASATNSSIVYLAGGGLGVYKTTNGGTSWSAVSQTPGYAGESYVSTVAVSPLDSSLVYASGQFPYVSSDGGTTWTYAGTGLTHAIVNEFAFDPLNSARAFAIMTAVDAGFAAKLNSSGTAFAWSTYLGTAGNSTEAFAVATDRAGNSFVTGLTVSLAPRVNPSAPRYILSNQADAFVTEVSDATPSCTYSVTPADQTINGGSQLASFAVLAPSGCAWTASSNETWAAIPLGASGTGTGTVDVQTGVNSAGASRSALITVAGQTVTLTQADSSCSYALNPNSVQAPAAGGPVTVDLTTGAGCPWYLQNDSQAISITSGASGTGDGTLAFTVAPNGGPSLRTFTILVLGFGPSLSISQAAGPVNGAAQPAILPAGVVPIFSTVNDIQPGSWGSIYGSNLGQTAVWNGDFPTELGGVSVSIDGKLAYLWYVSKGQINFQAPDDTNFGTPLDVVVTTSAGSATSTVVEEPAVSSFSLLDSKHVAGIIPRPDGTGAYGTGAGSYDILGPTGTSLGYKTVAAKAGDVVEIFGVGFGPTNPAVPAGQVFSGPAAPVVTPINVKIGGISVSPGFAGLVEAGLYQINVTIPEGAGTGDVPLIANVTGWGPTQAGVVISLQ
jgi:uncharacterized protein (TIGR03437 family)